MAYRIAAISVTLSDVQGHSPIASLFKLDLPYNYVAVDKISTDIERLVDPACDS